MQGEILNFHTEHLQTGQFIRGVCLGCICAVAHRGLVEMLQSWLTPGAGLSAGLARVWAELACVCDVFVV